MHSKDYFAPFGKGAPINATNISKNIPATVICTFYKHRNLSSGPLDIYTPDYGAHACMLPASLPLANYPQAILLTLHSSLPHFPSKIVPDIHSHC